MKPVYYFDDNIISLLDKYNGAKPVASRFFLKNQETFKDSVFIVRGIANYKYIRIFKNLSIDFFYIDSGYFGNLNAYYLKDKDLSAKGKSFHRIVYNNMQMDKIVKRKSDRLLSNLKYIYDEYDVSKDEIIKPWKKDGSKILLCPPSEKVASCFKIDKDEWTRSTIDEIKKYSNREIIVRDKNKSRHERINNFPIQEAFDDDIFITVTFNSIAATESIMHGIPALTLANNAAETVGIKSINLIESPIYPDRNAWLNNLAYQNFHIDEIVDGQAWKFMKREISK